VTALPAWPDPAPPWLDRTSYPFEGRLFTLPEGRLHVVDEGPRADPTPSGPLLFVHGTPEWSFGWRTPIRALATERRCVAPDLLGFGLSDKPPKADYRPERQAERIEALIDRLDLDRITLVVHDFGGPIGLAFAQRHPERVRGIVILNSWLWPLDGERRYRTAAALLGGPLGRLLYLRANVSPRVMLPTAVADRRRSLPPNVMRHYLGPFPDAASRHGPWSYARALLGSTPFYRALWEGRASLAAIPTLLLWGMRDPAFGPRELARMQEALPHAAAVHLDDVGHFPQEEAPERLLLHLEAFLARSEQR
jgi:haloalkane dehalogenase